MRLRFLAAATGVAVALALAAVAAAGTDSYNGVSFYPFTIAPGNLDCVQVNDDEIGWTAACDPVNVLFPGQTLYQVVARLHKAGWSDTAGGTQWLYFSTSALVPVQAQLARDDSAADDPSMRYHVRLWQAGPGLVVGNVHHEHGTPHKIDLDWDLAEGYLAHPFCLHSACTQTPLPTQDAVASHSGMWRGFANDARATVIPLPIPKKKSGK